MGVHDDGCGVACHVGDVCHVGGRLDGAALVECIGCSGGLSDHDLVDVAPSLADPGVLDDGEGVGRRVKEGT